MQTIAAIAATANQYPAWVKVAARAAFLVVFINGTGWLAMSWLALRGFDLL